MWDLRQYESLNVFMAQLVLTSALLVLIICNHGEKQLIKIRSGTGQIWNNGSVTSTNWRMDQCEASSSEEAQWALMDSARLLLETWEGLSRDSWRTETRRSVSFDPETQRYVTNTESNTKLHQNMDIHEPQLHLFLTGSSANTSENQNQSFLSVSSN